MRDSERIEAAVNVLIRYGQIPGDHHKAWVIDQVLRLLLGDRYEAAIGADHDHPWDGGIAP